MQAEEEKEEEREREKKRRGGINVMAFNIKLSKFLITYCISF
jgi:hypothetical protein